MEYRTKAQCQANMTKWRDVDAGTIAAWIDRAKSRRSLEIDIFDDGCREIRKRRRFVQASRPQIEHDRLYTYNCA